MKIKKDKHDKRIYIYFTDNLFLHFINEWEQIFGKYNWYSFHPIHIYFENEVMTGGLEFEFIFLGLGFRVRYNYDFEGSKAGKSFEDYENNHCSNCFEQLKKCECKKETK